MFLKCLNADIVKAFEEAYQKLKATNKEDEQQQHLVTYLNKHQQPYKELYITTQIDNIRHYGYSTTLIVKGAYLCLKRQLKTSQNDFLRFFEKLSPFYNYQVVRYTNAVAVAQNTTIEPFRNDRFYYGVVRIVNSKGLNLIRYQRALSK